MKTLKEHKAQLGGLTAIVSTLIVVGILIAAGFFIIQTLLEEDQFSDTAGAVTNETGLTISNATTSTVARATSPGFNTFAVSNCYGNATGAGVILPANTTMVVANYSVGASTGVITGLVDSNYTDVKCTYTYSYGEQAYVSVNETIEAMKTVPELLGLIILIAVIGIILAVIFNVIPGARVSGA